MKKIWFAFKTLFKYSPLWVILSVVVCVCLGLITPFLLNTTSNFIDAVISFVGGNIVFGSMLSAILIYGAIQLLNTLLSYLKVIAKQKTYTNIAMKFDADLLAKENNLKFEHFESGDVAKIKQKMVNPKDAVHNVFLYTLDIGITIIKIIGFFVFFCSISVWLLPAFLVVLIAEIVVEYQKTQRSIKVYWYNAASKVKLNNVSSILTSEGCQKDLRPFMSSGYLLEQRQQYLDDINKKVVSKIKKDSISNLIVGILEIAVGAIVLAVATMLLIKGNLSLGTITVAITAISSCFHLMSGIGSIASRLASFDTELKYYQEYMSLSERTIGTNQLPANFEIEFKNVCFTYPNTTNEILHNLNFKIMPSKNTAFVGENGCGKSTIIKLLAGLYQPTSGEILIDGVDINSLSAKARFELFGFVFQDRTVYSVPLRESVALGDTSKVDNDEELILALTNANCKSLFEKCDNNLDQVIGWRNKQGITFSGGENQRLQISRAFVSPHKFVVLDEPVASLDSYAENKMYESFLKFFKNKGVIVISHRLASSKLADEIFVFKKGELIAKGSHNELLKSCELYNTMFTIQAKQYELDKERSKNEEE